MASVVDKLLIAAYAVERGGRKPFTAEDLVVAAWRHFPDTFGLSGQLDERGQPAYPDSNRVFAEIMGSKPIRQRGLLVKVGKKMYELTESGRDAARLLQAETRGRIDEGAGSSLARDLVQELKRLLNTRALQKIDRGGLDDVTFHDACVFWGITPHSSGIELKGRMANVDRVIESAGRVLRGGRARFTHGGQSFGMETLDLLRRTQDALGKRFQAEILTIEKRRDERSR